MQLSHAVAYVAALILFVIAGTVAILTRAKWRPVIAVAVLCLVGAVVVGIAARSWVTERVLPGVVVYKGVGYAIGEGGQPGAYGPGMPVSCQGASALQHEAAWPLRQVGYVTWVSFGRVSANVGQFPRGYPVFVCPQKSEIFVAVRPACFVGAVNL